MPDPDPAATRASDAPVPPPDAAADLAGRTVGDFLILRKLGAGGMGQVYLARQLTLKRDVALKFLRADLNANPTARKRFQSEAEAVARLNHANIVHIYEIREQCGLWYMALEFVEGRNLRDHIERKGPPELTVALSIIKQVAFALQKAHEQGIVHRDIKPENILVTRKVEVKVTDFGLSRFFTPDAPALNLTQSGMAVGTPLYMSPEQVQGKPTDHRSDVYSFGVTCYHLLAGEPPFRGATGFDVAIKHVHDQPRPLADLRPDLPPDLCGMVHVMMAKDPAARYQSARDILRDLAKVREGLTGGPPLQLTGSLPARSGTPAALTLSGASGTAVPAAPAHPRWPRWVAAGLALLAAAAGGMVLFAATHRNPGPSSSTNQTAGLPDVRAPEHLTTGRERELQERLKSRDTKPEAFVDAAIELGLLYVREHRLNEAESRFQKLEAETFGRPPGPDGRPPSVDAGAAHLAGKLGRAVVLAHRDKAAESNKLVQEALREGWVGKVKQDQRSHQVYGFLAKHPPLFEAVADALTRNAANLGLSKLTPPALEQLRHPPGGKKE